MNSITNGGIKMGGNTKKNNKITTQDNTAHQQEAQQQPFIIAHKSKSIAITEIINALQKQPFDEEIIRKSVELILTNCYRGGSFIFAESSQRCFSRPTM
jgi:hypothetical protein